MAQIKVPKGLRYHTSTAMSSCSPLSINVYECTTLLSGLVTTALRRNLSLLVILESKTRKIWVVLVFSPDRWLLLFYSSKQRVLLSSNYPTQNAVFDP